MPKVNTYRHAMRFLAILIFHFIIKMGDLTFGDFTDFTFRGFIFSGFFISYWLFVWFLSDLIGNFIFKEQEHSFTKNRLKTYLYFVFHVFYSFIAAALFNQVYRWGDLLFFEMHQSWVEVSNLNPQLISILWLFYMIIFSFETYSHALLNRKEAQLQLERLKQENTQALYANLKAQIEPHFLFNSLSVLSSIVHTDTDLASDFILKLSKILRYVVENKGFQLLPLKEEIQFVNNYLFLMQTRFTEGIIFTNQLDESLVTKSYIPPVSLQTLIENAIKHNKFSKENPLEITLLTKEDYLVLHNNLNKRTDIENSTKQGLDNLSKRYAHFTNKTIKTSEINGLFTVSLPILTQKEYERFNF